ncbi:MAG TPA: hypothetical protein VN578_19225 [Candidatus Binatia bacterium]|nr:hypothetical protein [Candidatus Binatia bacterium]
MNFRVPVFCLTALLIVASPARADLLPNNFWVNSTFESGASLDQTTGTPANWTRDGNDTTICQVLTNNSVSPSHSLAVIDNNNAGFGEWHSDVSLIGNAANGDALNIQWFEMYNLSAPQMRLTVQFFDAATNVVGTTDFNTSGTTSPGWVSTIANSTFTRRQEVLVVPVGAVTMRCDLASGGDPAITGVMVIDDLSVARVTLLPGNFWVNSTFESGVNLDQTNGTPTNWTQGGGDPTICQVTTNNSVSPSHALAVIDNNANTVTGYGEWHSDVSLSGNATNGDTLNIQWFEMYSLNFASSFMRLTVQFFNATSNVVGTTDFTTTGTTNAGWRGTIANSTFTKRNAGLIVPVGAVRMRCALASGGFPGIKGVMVIDDLSVARAPMLLPGNFWLNSTFESGTGLDQTNGTPANWTRGGGDPTIDQVTTNNSVSPSHSLAIIDNNTDSVNGYGEWYSDVSLIGNATNGQALNLQWFEMYNLSAPEMRLTAQFFDSNNTLVSETHFVTTGTSSPGWVGTIADSTFTKRNGALLVPPGAVRLRCSLVSGGSGAITGVMVIDDLSVALNSAVSAVPPTILAGNFFPNPTFEVGSLLDDPANASPAGWTRGGSDTTIDQVTTSNSVSPTHSLSLVDNSTGTYGEWYQYLTLPATVIPGDVLEVQFFRIYAITNGPMRLTFGFRTAGGVDLGNATNFFAGDTLISGQDARSPGWLGSVAASPFELVSGRFLVPASAGQLSVKFASGGSGEVIGLTVIDDLSVRIGVPVITSITADVNGKTITWLSMPSKLYTVQFASTLGSPTVWTSLVTGLAGDPSLSNSYLDTAIHAGNTGFYRVIQQ